MASPRRNSSVCVLCTTARSTTVDHIPARLLFDRLPSNLITVPACESCNKAAQHDDECLRAFLVSLRDLASSDVSPSEALERVRKRTIQRLNRPDFAGLVWTLQARSELRREQREPDGGVAPGLYTETDGARIQRTITRYVRGLHFWSTGKVLPTDAPLILDRLFNRPTRPPEYWEHMVVAARYARTGTVTRVGYGAEFEYSFHAAPKGDALSVMVLEFYGKYAFVAVVMRPGTVLPGQVKVPY